MKFSCFAKTVAGALRKFRRNTDGAVAKIFIFAILPILLCVGAALDYVRATTAQSALTQAADNGALMAAQAGYQQLNAGNANWSAAAVAAGQIAFNANALAAR
jgi:Flp pilus assembly protein TadG